jgi:ubiquinone/menaquinone biosynthesis C-methylase UbiE
MGGSSTGATSDVMNTKGRVAAMFEQMASTYGSKLPLFDVFGGGLIAAAGLQAGQHVLDLACGRGACVRPACEAVGEQGRVLGIDLSSQMIELTAADLRRDDISNVDVRVGDAEHLELPDASFDAVVCGFAVFLFPQPQAALKESRRVLRPGGRFAASMFADRVLDYPWVFDALDQAGIDHDFRGAAPSPVATAQGLSEYLIDTGFGDVSITRVSHSFCSLMLTHCFSGGVRISWDRCSPA